MVLLLEGLAVVAAAVVVAVAVAVVVVVVAAVDVENAGADLWVAFCHDVLEIFSCISVMGPFLLYASSTKR